MHARTYAMTRKRVFVTSPALLVVTQQYEWGEDRARNGIRPLEIF